MSNSWLSPLALIVFGLLTAGGADRLCERPAAGMRGRWLFAASLAGWLGVWLGWWWLLQTVVVVETATALWLAAIVVAARVRERRRAAQQNELAWVLVAAGEQSLPPAAAVTALGIEQRGSVAGRLKQFAARLKLETAWTEALAPDPTLLSDAGSAGLFLGSSLKGVPPLSFLRDVAEWESARDAATQTLRTKALYLTASLAVVLTATVSLSAYIGRSLTRLVGETDVRLPASLTWLVEAGQSIAVWHAAHPQLARAVPLLAFVPCLLLAWRWRLLDGLAGRRSARSWLPPGVVLRLLAVGAEQATSPPDKIVAALSTRYELGAWGRRWQRAAAACAAGQPWWRSLAEERLIPPADAEPLHSAERRGTLPRALRERANAADRQSVRRLRAWVAGLLIVFLWSLVIGGALAQLAFWLPLLKLSLPA